MLTDLDQERVDKGVGYVHGEIDKLLREGPHQPGQGQPAHGPGHRLARQGRLRRRRLRHRGGVRGDGGQAAGASPRSRRSSRRQRVLATNTSSLSVTEMAAELQHPERVVGFHFFNPVAVLPLLEIVRGEQTDDATLATAFAVGQAAEEDRGAGQGRPGVRRQPAADPLHGRGPRGVIDEGTPVEVAEQALEPLGLPMSPLVLLQLVGPADRPARRGDPARGVPGPLHGVREPRAGRRGRQAAASTSGRPASRSSTRRSRRCSKQGDTALTAEQVRDRALDALAQEIRLMLDEGVVQDARHRPVPDLGAGWPFHLGGITPYLDRTGSPSA